MKDAIAKLLKKALKQKKVDLPEEEIASFIEIPPSAELGDYAFPCFFLAERLHDEAAQIAIELREEIGSPPEMFEDIQTKGPYINFFINRKNLARQIIADIAKEKDGFGSADLGKGKKVVIEHTSINPNASPHVGRARNAVIGDSIVNLMKFFGFKPEIHYYVNDVSKQIAMLVVAGAERLSFDEMLNKYIEIAKKVEKSKTLEKKVFLELQKFENGDKETLKKFEKITKTCLKGQTEILKKIGISYDVFDFESSYIDEARDVLEKLQSKGKLKKDKNGRLYLDQSDTQLKGMMKSPVFVLTRSDGTGLYPLRDLAYTIYKISLSKKNIIVLGEDQKLYFLQLKETLKLLGFDSPEVIHYSFILLKTKKGAKKMSTRKGDVVLLEDFLDDLVAKAKKEIKARKTKGNPETVAIAALKYKILKNSPNKIINFDANEALSFDGDTGPYILYSYARANSILKKSKKAKLNSKLQISKIEIPDLSDKEIELIKKISQFPRVAYDTFITLNPSLIANYSYQLAQIFNEFYHSCQVLGSHEESFRLALVDSFMHALKNSLALLGIETLEEM